MANDPEEDAALSKLASYYNNKIAVVTGAGSGIGRAIAQRLGALGARVYCTDVDGAAAQVRREARGGKADDDGIVARQDQVDHDDLEERGKKTGVDAEHGGSLAQAGNGSVTRCYAREAPASRGQGAEPDESSRYSGVTGPF